MMMSRVVRKWFMLVVLVCAAWLHGANFHLSGVSFSRWDEYTDDVGYVQLTFRGGKPATPADGVIEFEPSVEHCRFEKVCWDTNKISARGMFKPDTRYVVRVKGDYASEDGEELGHDNVLRFKTPRMNPLVGMMTDGRILPMGRKNWTMPLELRNVTRLTATVKRVFENNIVSYDLQSNALSRTARTVVEKQLPVRLQKDEKHQSQVVLDGILPKDKPGVYLVRFCGYDGDEQDSVLPGAREVCTRESMVIVTDLGIVVFHDDAVGNCAVCVRRLSDESPVANADVCVYDSLNQLKARCRTDADGMARMSVGMRADLGEDAVMDARIVMVAHGEDRNFVTVGAHGSYRGEDNVGIFAQMLHDRKAEELRLGAQSFMYFERGAARPGETIAVAAYVMDRTETEIKALEGYPCVLKLADPAGNVVFKKKVKTGRGGFVLQRIPLDASCPTGRYHGELGIDGGRLLGRADILVAAYVPDKVKVGVTVDKKNLALEETAKFAVDASYYYGGAANDLPLNVKISYGKADLGAEWREYSVGDEAHIVWPYDSRMIYDCVSDAETTEYECKKDDVSDVSVPMRVLFEATVTEPGGRGVTGRAELTVYPSPWYLGLKKTDGEAKARLEYKLFPGASEENLPKEAVDAQLSVSRVTWEYNLVQESCDGRYKYEWERITTPMPEKSSVVKLHPGGGFLDLAGLQPGQYEVVASVGDSICTRCVFWHWEGEGGVRAEDPNVLVFKTDRESYAPGDVATVSFEAADKGFAVVACGEATVGASKAVEIKAGRNDVRIPLPADLLTERYYCCVTAVTGAESSRRACGVAALKIAQAKRRLAVRIDAPENARPGATVDIGVSLADSEGKPVSGTAHVFLVDSGVLSLTDYKTPDIFHWCHGPRKSEIWLLDVYETLYPDLVIQDAARIGGDGVASSLALKAGRNSGPRSAVVVLDAVDVDASGKAAVKVSVPEHFGAMRVMCVAVSDGRHGSGEKTMTVRNEIDVLASAPRVVAPGDEFELTFLLNNFEVAGSDAFVFDVRLPEGLKALGEARQTGSLAVGGQRKVTLRVKAGALGPMAIPFELSVGAARCRKELSVLVRSVNPPVVECDSVVVAPGKSHVFALDGAIWLDGQASGAVTVAEPALAGVEDCLDWLNEYPYGCLEQTVARAFPFLYLPQLVAAGVISLEEAETHRPKLDAAVRRMMSMYDGAGRFYLWPGSTTRNAITEDASLFAAHYLYALDRQVPQNAAVLDKIDVQLLVPMMENTLYTRGRRAYGAYILSLRGKSASGDEHPSLGVARNILADGKADFASFLASAALVNLGHAAQAMPVFNSCMAAKAWMEQEAVSCFADDASRLGMALAILMEIQPKNPAATEIAAELQKMLRPDGTGYGTTQSNAWAVSGLASYGAHYSHAKAAGTHALNGGKPQPWNAEKSRKWTLKPGDSLEIRNTGAAPMFIRFSRTGVRNSPMTAVKGVMSVSRAYLDEEGNAVLHARQGALLTVRLTIRSSCALDSLVFVDMLPGGLEIEDDALATRVAAGGKAEGRPSVLGIAHVDKRDDRLLLFGDITAKGVAEYTYKVRAVSRGRYALAPATGEAMYAPDIRAVLPGQGTLVVE